MADRYIGTGRYEWADGRARVTALTVQGGRLAEVVIERGGLRFLTSDPPVPGTLEESRRYFAALLGEDLARNASPHLPSADDAGFSQILLARQHLLCSICGGTGLVSPRIFARPRSNPFGND